MLKKTDMTDEDQMGVEIRQEIAEGSYSNLAVITHSINEFIIDFAAMLPGFQKPHVTNRIVMTPESAKKLLLALNENIMKFESANGKIALPNVIPAPDKFKIGGGNKGAKS